MLRGGRVVVEVDVGPPVFLAGTGTGTDASWAGGEALVRGAATAEGEALVAAAKAWRVWPCGCSYLPAPLPLFCATGIEPERVCGAEAAAEVVFARTTTISDFLVVFAR